MFQHAARLECMLRIEHDVDMASKRGRWWRNLEYVPNGCVIHSFRHSMRDRLRAVQCPSDMIDQIGGWTTAGVGQGYGEGYNLKTTSQWVIKISPRPLGLG